MTITSPSSKPTVSLGLPVFNGEKFLAETVDAILSQTFGDFELIISDNASTDATASICNAYARKDSRILYFRQSRNIGAASNYDFVFHQSTGKYFKWCAHDDLIGKDFLAACVSHLDTHPGDAGALPREICLVDKAGVKLHGVSIDFGGEDDNGASRFAAFAPISRLIHCAPFFSLFRRDILVRTGLHGHYISSDRVLIAEVLLHGRITLLPESVFLFRIHPDQYSARLRDQGQEFSIHWIDPQKKGKRTFRHSRYILELFRATERASLSIGDRFVGYRGIAKLIWASRGPLLKEALIPFYRNGKPTDLGQQVRCLRRRD